MKKLVILCLLFPLAAFTGAPSNSIWDAFIEPSLPNPGDNVILFIRAQNSNIVDSFQLGRDGNTFSVTGTGTFVGGPNRTTLQPIELGALDAGDYEVRIDIARGLASIGFQGTLNFSVLPAPPIRVPTLSGIGVGVLVLGMLFVAMRRF